MIAGLRTVRRAAILGVVGFLTVVSGRAAAAATTIDVYTRAGCPHCVEAGRFLEELVRESPGLVVVEHDVARDREALERLRELAARSGVATPGVPTFVVGDGVIVGFDPETTPARLRALLGGVAGGRTEPEVCAADPSRCETALSKSADLPLVGRVDVDRLGLPLFTILVGLADGFNPCATWVLLFLLAMLVNLKNRSRMALIAGTFVIVSGVVYFAFMAAWLTFFMAIGVSRPVRVVLAAVALLVGTINVKDFFAWGRGPSLSIPDAAKPGLYARVRGIIHAEHLAGAMVGIVVLALLVNLVELLCTAGLPALYTAILTSQALPRWKYYAYLTLYIGAYMLDDAILVTLGVVTLGKRKLQERGGRWLKLVSGLIVLVLGMLLLLRPAWLGF
jgi:glutaredoxin